MAIKPMTKQQILEFIKSTDAEKNKRISESARNRTISGTHPWVDPGWSIQTNSALESCVVFDNLYTQYKIWAALRFMDLELAHGRGRPGACGVIRNWNTVAPLVAERMMLTTRTVNEWAHIAEIMGFVRFVNSNTIKIAGAERLTCDLLYNLRREGKITGGSMYDRTNRKDMKWSWVNNPLAYNVPWVDFGKTTSQQYFNAKICERLAGFMSYRGWGLNALCRITGHTREYLSTMLSKIDMPRYYRYIGYTYMDILSAIGVIVPMDKIVESGFNHLFAAELIKIVEEERVRRKERGDSTYHLHVPLSVQRNSAGAPMLAFQTSSKYMPPQFGHMKPAYALGKKIRQIQYGPTRPIKPPRATSGKPKKHIEGSLLEARNGVGPIPDIYRTLSKQRLTHIITICGRQLLNKFGITPQSQDMEMYISMSAEDRLSLVPNAHPDNDIIAADPYIPSVGVNSTTDPRVLAGVGPGVRAKALQCSSAPDPE